MVRRVGLPERLEHKGEERRWYPFAVVTDGQFDGISAARQANAHNAAWGRELDGIGHEVGHDLLKAERIALDGTRGRVDVDAHVDVLRIRGTL